ncbi:MAG: phage scaffolding protein [Halanaerobiales bacterium]|nr:phage scaffolding protein [Halanaerobiales bacterium]
MEWLKNLLSDVEIDNKEELINNIKKKIGENFVENKQYSKKTSKIDELKSELKTAKGQLEEFDNKIKELKPKAENAEELQSELNNITTEYENYKEQESERITNIKTTSALEKKLLADNVPEDLVDLVVNDFDVENLELNEEGELLNYESQREKAKKKRPSAFAEEKITGDEPKDGDEGKIVDNPFDSKTFNLKKQGELVKEKPEVAKKLIKAAGKNPATYGLK